MLKKTRFFQGTVLLLSLILVSCGGGGSSSSSPAISGTQNTGIAGSMSRFAIIGDYLYAIAGPDIQLFDITVPEDPVLWNRVTIDVDIETLFPYQKYLFIGSETGMHIYDNTDPLFPAYVTKFEHAQSCDPVVVQGNYAYVTLRSNTLCSGANNQLDIIDISDIMNPVLVRSYPMQGPKGLAIDREKLFVCDGDSGLKVFDVTDPASILTLHFIPDSVCYDVIASNGLLVVSGISALLQYDYTSVPLTELSTIPAGQ